MNRISWIALAVAGVASAQQSESDPAQALLRTTTSTMQRAGTLHLASGAWTPPPPPGSQLATAGTAYSNSCLPAAGSTFFQTLNTWSLTDDGRAPSPTSPAPATGDFTTYRVTAFEFSYITRELDPGAGGPGATVRARFYDSYAECSGLPASTPAADFALGNLPGSQVQGQDAWWLLTIDLTGGFEFDLKADGDGVFDNNALLDRFGVQFDMTNQTGTALGAVGGFVLAGDAAATVGCAAGDETYWGNPAAMAGDGLDNGPGIYLDTQGGTGGFASQCVNSLGGYPGLYLRLIVDVEDCNNNHDPDFNDIFSGVSADTNANGVPDECESANILAYCTSGTTTNGCIASIAGSGTPSASASSGFTINISSVEGQKQGLIFYGINNTGFTPLPWSAGSSSFLCVKPPTQRTPVQTSGGTTNQCDGSLTIDWNAFRAANPNALGAPFNVGATVYSQGWFRDPPQPKTTSLSNGLQFNVLP